MRRSKDCTPLCLIHGLFSHYSVSWDVNVDLSRPFRGSGPTRRINGIQRCDYTLSACCLWIKLKVVCMYLRFWRVLCLCVIWSLMLWAAVCMCLCCGAVVCVCVCCWLFVLFSGLPADCVFEGIMRLCRPEESNPGGEEIVDNSRASSTHPVFLLSLLVLRILILQICFSTFIFLLWDSFMMLLKSVSFLAISHLSSWHFLDFK